MVSNQKFVVQFVLNATTGTTSFHSDRSFKIISIPQQQHHAVVDV
ncbi:MAG TPA: hypothetical protein V6C78_29895 [Crinalium sp.]